MRDMHRVASTAREAGQVEVRQVDQIPWQTDSRKMRHAEWESWNTEAQVRQKVARDQPLDERSERVHDDAEQVQNALDNLENGEAEASHLDRWVRDPRASTPVAPVHTARVPNTRIAVGAPAPASTPATSSAPRPAINACTATAAANTTWVPDRDADMPVPDLRDRKADTNPPVQEVDERPQKVVDASEEVHDRPPDIVDHEHSEGPESLKHG